MTIEELKAKVKSYRASLEEKSGKICHFSETGPVGMSLIHAIVAALETMDQRLTKLEGQLPLRFA